MKIRVKKSNIQSVIHKSFQTLQRCKDKSGIANFRIICGIWCLKSWEELRMKEQKDFPEYALIIYVPIFYREAYHLVIKLFYLINSSVPNMELLMDSYRHQTTKDCQDKEPNQYPQ